MRKITLITTCLFVTLQIGAQNFVTTTVWKAGARSGGVFIGVSEDTYNAENTIDEISFDKQGTKYEILGSEIIEAKINIFRSASVFDDFKSDHDELEYKYISEIELISLEYIEDDNLEMAIRFYQNASRVKSESIILEHLTELHQNYSKYIFSPNESPTLVGYSD